MDKEDIVSAIDYCQHNNIELSFIQTLHEHGMIDTVVVEERLFLPLSQLPRLEKIVRLHFELDINLEGIETINHLLDRMEKMRDEINKLNNLLKAYEG